MRAAPLPVVELDGQTLTIDDVVAIARGRAEAEMAPEARERNAAAERLVRELLDRGEPLYGTSTGVGSLRSSPSRLEDAGDHQWPLVRRRARGGGARRARARAGALRAARRDRLHGLQRGVRRAGGARVRRREPAAG